MGKGFFPELNQTEDFSDCMSVCSAMTGCSGTMADTSSRSYASASFHSSSSSVNDLYQQIANLKAEHAKRQAKLEAAIEEHVGATSPAAAHDEVVAEEEEPDFD